MRNERGKKRSYSEAIIVLRIFAIFVIVSIVAVIVTTILAMKKDLYPAMVIDDDVNFRKEISFDSGVIIDTLNCGDIVQITGKAKNDRKTGKKWFPAEFLGQKGYIAEEYISNIEDFDYGRLGIDVSHHNQDQFQNSAELKEFLERKSISFGIIKLGGRTSESSMIYQDEYSLFAVKAFEDANVPYGFYWFYTAKDEAKAREDAEAIMGILEIIKDSCEYFNLPIYLDLELEKENFSEGTMELMAEVAKITHDILKENEYNVGIYTSKALYEYVKDISAETWIACYNEDYTEHFPTEYYVGKGRVWQFTDQPSLISRVALDLNYASKEFSEVYLQEK